MHSKRPAGILARVGGTALNLSRVSLCTKFARERVEPVFARPEERQSRAQAAGRALCARLD